MKIYTRTGDAGQTSLFSGRRLSKADVRVEAYGTVDELNACLGILRDNIEDTDGHRTRARAQLLNQQGNLFALGAALADDRSAEEAYRLPAGIVEELEKWIDEMNAALPRMTHFILPGGNPTISYAHLARTVCRRAERRVVEMGTDVPAGAVVYLNRLSDYLFVLARYLGKLDGVAELRWES